MYITNNTYNNFYEVLCNEQLHKDMKDEIQTHENFSKKILRFNIEKGFFDLLETRF